MLFTWQKHINYSISCVCSIDVNLLIKILKKNHILHGTKRNGKWHNKLTVRLWHRRHILPGQLAMKIWTRSSGIDLTIASFTYDFLLLLSCLISFLLFAAHRVASTLWLLRLLIISSGPQTVRRRYVIVSSGLKKAMEKSWQRDSPWRDDGPVRLKAKFYFPHIETSGRRPKSTVFPGIITREIFGRKQT